MEKRTDKFDQFLDLLDANIFSRQLCMLEDKQNIDLSRLLKTILEKKSCGQNVSSSEYKALAAITCPGEENSIMEQFPDLLEQYPYDTYLAGDNCHNTDCVTCWKEHIDNIVDFINSSEITTKRLVPDLINQKFIELEDAYNSTDEQSKQ